MVRGKLELKKIENKINRQVTFAKRRNGLFKKAYELATLCDAEVAIIVFSNRGKLSEFCTPSSMLKTLEKYEKCNYTSPNTVVQQIKDPQLIKSQQEYMQLKAHVAELQRWQRNVLGEDLGPLSCKELDQLENQLGSSLKHVRSTRTQMMLDQLSDLQRNDKMLRESNKDLWEKLQESGQDNNIHQVMRSRAEINLFGYGHQHGEEIFSALELQPRLQIGFHSEQMAAGASTSTYSPQGWIA